MIPWCDAHVHLQDPRLAGHLETIIRHGRAHGVAACVVNATSEADWPAVASLANSYPDWVIPSFGIHPWHAASAAPGWEDRLARVLEEFPHAGIGECGLDRWIRQPGLDVQLPVFAQQLLLARRLNRTVTVHCLKAWGSLLEVLRCQSPPRMLIHSYGGSAETARELVRLGASFSFSGYFLFPRKQAVLEVFKSLPRNRILLETDAPDMIPPDDVIAFPLPDGSNHPANLPAIGRALAAELGMPADELAGVMLENFSRLFRWNVEPMASTPGHG